MEFELLTNGMIEGYPKKIHGSLFKVKHWKDFAVASDEGMEEVLSEALDGIIDFTRTEGIKTSRDLTPIDRKYLFLQQRLNCIGEDVDTRFTCPECKKEGPMKVSLEKLHEIRIDKRVTVYEKHGLKLRVPRIRDLADFNRKSREMKDNPDSTKYFNFVDEKQPDVTLANGDVLTGKVEKRKELKPGILLYLIYYPYVDKEFKDFDAFLDWIFDQDGPILKWLEEFKVSTYHGFDTAIKIPCKHCKVESEVECPLDITFLLNQ